VRDRAIDPSVAAQAEACALRLLPNEISAAPAAASRQVEHA
jgi:hypothetical protein